MTNGMSMSWEDRVMRTLAPVFISVTMLLAVPCGVAQTSAPTQEFRGAWIATVSKLDSPNTRRASPAAQQPCLVRWRDDR